MPRYTLYHTMHSDDKAYGGTTLIIRSSTRYYEISKYQREFLQVTSIVVEDRNDYITISTIYSRLKHAIKYYITFFKIVGNLHRCKRL